MKRTLAYALVVALVTVLGIAFGIGSVGAQSPGEEIWNFTTNDQGSSMSSPTVVDGTVYFGSKDSKMYAVDATTGDEEWNFSTGSMVVSSPNVVGGTVYFGSNDTKLYAVDAETGNKDWEFETNGSVLSSPTTVDGIVYVGSGSRFDDKNNVVHAVYASNGTEAWNYSIPGDNGGAADGVRSSPAVLNGTVYIGATTAFTGGQLYALDAKTGQKQWNFDTVDWVWSAPTVWDGDLYFGNEDFTFYSAYTNGTERWTNSAATSGFSKTTATVKDGLVYFGDNDDKVHALDASQGVEVWNSTTGRGIDSAPTVADETVYVGSNDEKLYALNATTGDEKWNFTANGNVYSSPTVSDGVVYFAGSNFSSGQEKLYAVQTGTSNSSDGSRVKQGLLGHTDEFATEGPSDPSGNVFESALVNRPEFVGPPTNTGELDNTLYEDLSGDGDGKSVGQTVTVFGELIRGNDLGLTDEQARKFNWNAGSPETEVTVADMVTLFGKQIRAD